jgi:dTDP-4-dehydrorhamnose 3,5-epimerase-like enzyme
MTMPYVPEAARGFAWNDPTIGVAWPAGEKIMSERDRDNPPLSALEAEIREADQ